jgi:hypothetical protein
MKIILGSKIFDSDFDQTLQIAFFRSEKYTKIIAEAG